MQPLIYLDNCATTRPSDEAVAEVLRVSRELWANPSSPHGIGLAAAGFLESCRTRLAALLGCLPDEVVFTSGGTEADVAALRGASCRRSRILFGAIEHPAITETCRHLEEEGRTVVELPVDGLGLIDEGALAAALAGGPALVSIQHGNSEVGTVQRLQRLAGLVKRASPESLFHCDAVQTFGKLPIPLNGAQLDLLSISSHKLHGPRGVGALFVRKGTPWKPLLTGGDQEHGLRAGTQDLPGIAGFVLAAEQACGRMGTEALRLEALAAEAWRVLEAGIPGIALTGAREGRVPGHLSFRIPGIASQNLVHFLEAEGVIVSSGSACHSRNTRVSHVIRAMKYGIETAAYIRLCLCPYSSGAEVEAATEIITRTARRLLEKS